MPLTSIDISFPRVSPAAFAGYSMTGESMAMLVVDDLFPEIELSIAGGGIISLPKDVEGNWTYVAFYRGGW